MESFYKKVYLHSWQIIKTHWYLLFFGIFVMTLGLTGDFKTLLNFESKDLVLSTLLSWVDIFRTFAVTNINANDIPILSQTIGVFFIFAIILVLAISSQGALIHATGQNYNTIKKDKKEHPLVENLRVGVENFWPLFGMSVLNLLVGIGFGAGVIQPILYLLTLTLTSGMAEFFVAIVVFFSFIPLIIIISFVTRYGAAYIIIKKQSVTKAFFSAWRLFHVYWLISLENALALTILTGLYSVIIIALLVFVAVPFLILGYIVSSLSPAGFWVLLFAGTLLDTAIFLIAVAFYGAYYNIVWTEVFLRLVGAGKTVSKTERLAKKHLPRLTK